MGLEGGIRDITERQRGSGQRTRTDSGDGQWTDDGRWKIGRHGSAKNGIDGENRWREDRGVLSIVC